MGRGSDKSYCFLLMGTETENAKERLLTMKTHTDGFKIAEKDLEMRGTGEFLGTKQKGAMSSPYFKLPTNTRVLMRAKEMAKDSAFDDITNVMRELFGADYSNFENELKHVTLNS